MKIDSHQHFWRYDAVRDAWITESMAVLKRDFLPEHLAAELAANDVAWVDRRNSFEDLGLLVADRLAVGSDRRLHGKIGQHLKQMVLNDVTNGAGLIVEGAPALHPERLRHRDLHTLDVSAVPQRLEQ